MMQMGPVTSHCEGCKVEDCLPNSGGTAPAISEKRVGVADQEGQWLSLWSVVLYYNISVAVVKVFKEGGLKWSE